MTEHHLLVLNKYLSAGWGALDVKPHRGPCDVIANHKRPKLHFVKVITAGTETPPEGEMNLFIQNAFSNGAIPVIATVTASPMKGEVGAQKIKITFKDANTNGRVVV